jgi:hypothetical protein
VFGRSKYLNSEVGPKKTGLKLCDNCLAEAYRLYWPIVLGFGLPSFKIDLIQVVLDALITFSNTLFGGQCGGELPFSILWEIKKENTSQ